jgi:ABC-2 type transport system ATP-binding protein
MMVDFVGDGGAVFVCTHTLPVVEHIATRIGVIRQGSVIAQGTLKELRTKTKVRGSLEEVFVRLVGKNEEEIYGKHPSIQ